MYLVEATGGGTRRMNYVNFPGSIMRRFRVIISGWPLEQFKSPSSLDSPNDVEVLIAGFESGRTYFRKMGTAEYEDWRTMYYARGGVDVDSDDEDDGEINNAIISGPGEINGEISRDVDGVTSVDSRAASSSTLSSTSSSASASASAQPPPPDAPLAGADTSSQAAGGNAQKRPHEGIAGTTEAGTLIVVPGKKRKTRSDAGVKRGPRKKKAEGAVSASSTTATGSARTTSKSQRKKTTAPSVPSIVAPVASGGASTPATPAVPPAAQASGLSGSLIASPALFFPTPTTTSPPGASLATPSAPLSGVIAGSHV